MRYKKAVNYTFIFALMIVIYIGILMVSSLIPFDKAYGQIQESYLILEEEGLYPKPIFKGTILDNWSDALLFNIAITQNSENVLVSALANNRISTSDESLDVIGCLGVASKYYSNDKAQIEDYSRYWLGIVFFIKIMSIFLDVAKIRKVVLIIYIVLQALLFTKIYNEIGIDNSIAYLISTCIIPTFYHVMCLSFSTDILIMQIYMILIILIYKTKFWHENRLFAYFFVGSVTFYINFLSVPLYTLVFPLLLELQLTNENKIKKSVGGIVTWLSGYTITILVKQLLSKIILGYESGTEHIRLWSGIEDSMNLAQRWEIVTKRFMANFNYTNIAILIFVVILLIVIGLLNKRRIQLPKANDMLAYIVLGALPFVWLFVFAKHASHGFDSMYFAITIYAFLMLIVNLTNRKTASSVEEQ